MPDVPIYNFTDTWNGGATTYKGIQLDVTDTASAAGSKLLDLQVGGSSKFSVDKAGIVKVFAVDEATYVRSSQFILGHPTSLVRLFDDGAATLQLGADHATAATGQTIKAHDVAAGTGADLTLSGGSGSVANGDIILSGNVHASQITGTDNNFVGDGAGSSNSGSNNSGFGKYSLYSNTGGYNTANGNWSLLNNTGSYNTAAGFSSLIYNTGSSNTAIGNESGRYQSGGTTSLTTASNSVFLGALTKGIQGATNQIVIGHTAESIGANSVVLGNDSIVTTALKGNVGVGTTTPNANAILDVSSTTKAFIPPRMTTVQKNAVASPTAGMVVYDSTLSALSVYASGAWTAVGSGGGSGAFGADVNTQITPSTAIVLDQATGNEAALSLDYTTNKATSGDDTGLLINQTDTNSPGTSKFIDAQVGGVSQFSVDAPFPVLRGISGYYIGLYGGVTSNLYSLGLAGKLGFSYNGGPYLERDAANTLAQRNGVNAQSFNIYNTYTDASNNERGHIGWNETADTFVIGNTSVGTGAGRFTQLGSGVNGSIVVYDHVDNTGMLFKQGGNNKFHMRPEGLMSSTSVYYDLGQSSAGRWGNAYTQALDVDQGTLTDDAQALNIASTWNDAADTFTLIKADVTNTASAAGSKLMDLQVGGTSKFSVNSPGQVTIASSHVYADLASPGSNSGIKFVPFGGRLNSNSYTRLAWTNTAQDYGIHVNTFVGLAPGGSNTNLVPDVFVARAAAATLQLGTDHATAATGQTIKAHDVVTGTGADLTLSGGTGSVANGDIILSGDVHASQITGTNNNFVGEGAGESNSGTNNSGFGGLSLYQNTGSYNTASGFESLSGNTGGDSSGFGYRSLYNNTGLYNTASGMQSLFGCTGSYNTGSGVHSLRSNTGANNTANGVFSLYLNTGDHNTASGYESLRSNTGSNNTAGGYASLIGNTGSSNTASGFSSGRYQSGGTSALTTASNSVFLGNTTKGIQGATNQIVIGDTAESIGANTVVLGNDSIVTTALKGTVTTSSVNFTNTAGTIHGKWDGTSRVFYTGGDAFAVLTSTGETRLYDLGAFGWTASSAASSGTMDLILRKAAAATLQLGTDHATVATDQTIKAHDVVTGTGADLTLSGGTGSVANGDVTVSHGGSESFRVTSQGLTTGGLTNASLIWKDLTIGSTSPGVGGGMNIVAGANGQGGVYFARGISGDDRFRGFLYYDHLNDTFALGSNGVTAITLDSTQNVGIGTTTPNANAILDVSSTTKAFIPPRMTTTQKNAVASPTAGMVVYDSTLSALSVYASGAWGAVGGGGGGGGGAFTAAGDTTITPTTALLLNGIVGNEAALTLAYETNKTAGNDTGLLINQTDTNSPGNSNLLDLQVGGASKFSVSANGAAGIYATGTNKPTGFGIGSPATSLLGVWGGTRWCNAFGTDRMVLDSTSWLGFSSLAGSSDSFAGGNNVDLRLYRDSANTLAQRNGVNAQTFNIYNTYTSATDYERAHIGWNDTADTFVIGTEAHPAGGTARGIHVEPGGALKLKAATGNQLTLGANGSYTWQLTTGHVFGPTGNNVRDLASTGVRLKSAYLGTTLDISQGTLTDDAQALNITSTWNDAADTFTLIKADVTDTASAAGSKLMDLRVGGTSKFSVDNEGVVNIGSTLNSYDLILGNTTNSSGLAIKNFGVVKTIISAYHATYNSGYLLRWQSSTTASSSSADLILGRDAANTLAQRNGVNAQTSNIYNTDDGAGNYERGHIGWNDTANAFVIGTEEAGTGVARSLLLKGNNDILMEVQNNTGSQGGIRTSTGVPLMTFRGNKTGFIEGSNLTIDSLPTSDPVAAGRLWNDSGTLKISAG